MLIILHTIRIHLRCYANAMHYARMSICADVNVCDVHPASSLHKNRTIYIYTYYLIEPATLHYKITLMTMFTLH